MLCELATGSPKSEANLSVLIHVSNSKNTNCTFTCNIQYHQLKQSKVIFVNINHFRKDHMLLHFLNKMKRFSAIEQSILHDQGILEKNVLRHFIFLAIIIISIKMLSNL